MLALLCRKRPTRDMAVADLGSPAVTDNAFENEAKRRLLAHVGADASTDLSTVTITCDWVEAELRDGVVTGGWMNLDFIWRQPSAGHPAAEGRVPGDDGLVECRWGLMGDEVAEFLRLLVGAQR